MLSLENLYAGNINQVVGEYSLRRPNLYKFTLSAIIDLFTRRTTFNRLRKYLKILRQQSFKIFFVARIFFFHLFPDPSPENAATLGPNDETPDDGIPARKLTNISGVPQL